MSLDEQRFNSADMWSAVEFERINPKVEAIRLSGTKENVAAIEKFFGGERKVRVKHTVTRHWSDDEGSVHHHLRIYFADPVDVIDDSLDVQTGDWVVRVQDRGQMRTYAMSDDFFKKEFRPKQKPITATINE